MFEDVSKIVREKEINMREFWIERGSYIWRCVERKDDLAGWTHRNSPIHVIEKSAYDRVVEALKFYADKNNHTVRRGGESDTRMRIDKGASAREALKEVGEL